MALAMQRQNFCSPTSPTGNKELKLMEFSLIGHLSYMEFLKVVSWGHSYLTYLLMTWTLSLELPSCVLMLIILQHTPASAANTTALELSFNQDLQKLSTWFYSNYFSYSKPYQNSSYDFGKFPAAMTLPLVLTKDSWRSLVSILTISSPLRPTMHG